VKCKEHCIVLLSQILSSLSLFFSRYSPSLHPPPLSFLPTLPPFFLSLLRPFLSLPLSLLPLQVENDLNRLEILEANLDQIDRKKHIKESLKQEINDIISYKGR
jgi:hypothetical protein